MCSQQQKTATQSALYNNLKTVYEILHGWRGANKEHGGTGTIGKTGLDHGRRATVHSALHHFDDLFVAKEGTHSARVGL